MGLLAKLQARLELLRLEKKYTNRRSGPSSPAAQYVDGEYIYQTQPSISSRSIPSHQSQQRPSPQYTSSSAAYAASQNKALPPPPTSVSFSDISSSPHPPNPSSFWTTINAGSGTVKHSSWQSLAPSSFGGSGITTSSSTRNSTLTAAESQHTPSPAISKNSRGQTWEPPKQSWGGDGTDAFKVDRKEFKFDVERDRLSVGR